MIIVDMARERGIADICGICGKPIKPGTVFALVKIRGENGEKGWIFAHLWCDARRRGATKERLHGMGIPRATAKA